MVALEPVFVETHQQLMNSMRMHTVSISQHCLFSLASDSKSLPAVERKDSIEVRIFAAEPA